MRLRSGPYPQRLLQPVGNLGDDIGNHHVDHDGDHEGFEVIVVQRGSQLGLREDIDDLDGEPKGKCLHDDHHRGRQVGNRGEGHLRKQDPSEELAASLREFIDTQVDGLAVETGEKLGAVDPEGLTTRFKETYAKWEGLMADIPADDLDAMAELFKTEVYDKLDVTSYGL